MKIENSKLSWTDWFKSWLPWGADKIVPVVGPVLLGVEPKPIHSLTVDLEAIKKRREVAPPTDVQIQAEVKQFSHLLSRIVAMRAISSLCKIEESEDFYLNLSVHAGNDDQKLQAVFFKHLDDSKLFFLVRWVAKIAYTFFLPFSNKTVEDTTFSIFKKVESTLDRKHNLEFNEDFNRNLGRSNRLLEKWIIALKNCAQADSVRGIRGADGVLSEELSKPQYHEMRSPAQFYLDITKSAVKRYYVDISFGEYIFDRALEFKIHSISKYAFISKPIHFIVKPIIILLAGILRGLLLGPDFIFNKVFKSFLERTLIQSRVVENLMEMIIKGVSTNTGISLPVLKALNENLEEILAQTQGKISAPTAKNDLSRNNQEALKRNVQLVHRAVNYYQRTAGELKKIVEHYNDMEKDSDKAPPSPLSSEIESALEDVFKNLYAQLTDPDLLKGKGFYILKSLNESLTKPEDGDSSAVKSTEQKAKAAKKRNDEFLAQEKRLFELLQNILETAINIKVKEAFIPHTQIKLTKDGPASNMIVNWKYKDIAPLVTNILDMALSREFVNYQVRSALAAIYLSK